MARVGFIGRSWLRQAKCGFLGTGMMVVVFRRAEMGAGDMETLKIMVKTQTLRTFPATLSSPAAFLSFTQENIRSNACAVSGSKFRAY